MRDLTKSMVSYGWAMSVFGFQQMMNLLTPCQGDDPYAKATRAFDGVTKATTDTLEGSLRSAYNAGANLQNGLIDLFFCGIMSAGLDPNRWARMGNQVAQDLGDFGRRAAQSASAAPSANPFPASATGTPSASTPPASGWGPMPR